MDAVIHFLQQASLGTLALCFLAENVFIAIAAVAMGEGLTKWFSAHRVAEEASPLTGKEIGLACSTVFFNSLVTSAGLLLWRSGIIHFWQESGWAALLDFGILVLAMDGAMYFAHRVAHLPFFFKVVHRTHHEYDNPRPLTLFVMNPLEALSFGVLWLVLLSVYDATWLGMSAYLVFNVAFGLIGHIGVEPLPQGWKQAPLLKYISTSSFHAGHHQRDQHNFGFYTLIWDRIFGTLEPDYENPRW